MARRLLFSLAALLVFAAPQIVLAQDLPFHTDPTAREIVSEQGTVAAIRFLTTGDFPPFNFQEASGQLVGFNIDLTREICDTLEVVCTIQSWPWEQVANALADHQGDALIAGLELSEETVEQFDFSSVYLMLPGRFVASEATMPGFDPETLSGQTVAVREGSSHQQFLTNYVPDIEQQGFESEIAALEAVRDGEVSAYFGDAMRASFWLNENPDCCAFVGEPYFRPDLFGPGLAIAVPMGADEVRQAINSALGRLKRSGQLDELYLRWFPVGFY